MRLRICRPLARSTPPAPGRALEHEETSAVEAAVRELEGARKNLEAVLDDPASRVARKD